MIGKLGFICRSIYLNFFLDEDDLPENQPDDEEYEDVEDDEDDEDENEGSGEEEVMGGNEEWVSDDGANDDMEDEETKKDEIPKKAKSTKKVRILEEPKQEKTKIKEKVVPFLDSSKKLKEGEYLEFDNSAYEMMHRANTDWYKNKTPKFQFN